MDSIGTVNDQHREEMVNKMQDALNAQSKIIQKLSAQLEAAINGQVPEHEQINFADIFVYGGISGQDRHPFVEMRWGLQRAQLGPEEAKHYAFQLLVAATEAEQDHDLYQFLRSHGEQDDEAAFNLMGHYRRFREGLRMERLEQAFQLSKSEVTRHDK